MNEAKLRDLAALLRTPFSRLGKGRSGGAQGQASPLVKAPKKKPGTVEELLEMDSVAQGKAFAPSRPAPSPEPGTVEALLSAEPVEKRQTVESPDWRIYDKSYGDMLVPLTVKSPEPDGSMFDPFFVGMKVLKQAPPVEDATIKYDPAFPGMKVPLPNKS